jgi:hypothetical protein
MAGMVKPFGVPTGIHKENLNDAVRLPLVEQGRAAEIVVSGRTGVPGFAAKELQYFIEKSTGVKPEIVTSRTPGKIAIIIGDGMVAREAGIDVSALPRDGFIIRGKENTLVIAGRDTEDADVKKNLRRGIWAQFYERGTLFGVYHFLERFLGVRFYFPGEYGTIIPKHASLVLPGMDIVEAPDFSRHRASTYSGVVPDELKGAAKMEFCNTNMMRLRSETQYIPNMHSLSRIGLAERFAESNPEFFALLGNGKRDNDLSLPGHRGHLCYASEGLKNVVYEDAKAFLTGQSAKSRGVVRNGRNVWDPSAFQPGFFNIMPQDGHAESSYCRCPECSKYYSKGKASELVWRFVADIAGKLEKDGVPGYVTSMAYGPAKDVPEVKLPDNVIVMLALTGPWREGNPEDQAQLDGLITAWNKKISPHRVWLWNYADKHASRNIPGIPTVTPRCVGTYYQRNAKDICGAFLQTDTDRYMFNYLNWYVFFKLAWRNDIDVDALLDEHYRLMFGKGAPEIAAAFDTLEKLWVERIVGNTVDSPLGPRSIVPSEAVVWEEIYSDKQIKELQGRFDKAAKLTAGDADSLKRIAFIREQILAPLERQHANYLERKSEISDLQIYAGNSVDKAAQIVLVPLNANEAKVRTDVRIYHDDRFLYVKFDCQEPKMKNLSSSKREKDDRFIWQDSSVEIFLNPSCDRKDVYQIIVNASGSISDQRMLIDDEAGKKMDWDWDSAVDVKITRNKSGWIADIKIPLAKLGIKSSATGSSIVANFGRSRNLKDVDKKENQFYTWSPYLQLGFHDVTRFGTMVLGDSPFSDGSIVRNGDFTEEGRNDLPKYWNAPRNQELRAGVSIDKRVFRTGGAALKLETDKGSGDLHVMQNLKKLKPDTKYHLTFFIKTEDVVGTGRFAGAVVNMYTSKNEWFPLCPYVGTVPWAKQGFYFKTNAKTNADGRSYIRLRLLNATGKAWFDDVKLREISE